MTSCFANSKNATGLTGTYALIGLDLQEIEMKVLANGCSITSIDSVPVSSLIHEITARHLNSAESRIPKEKLWIKMKKFRR